MNEETLLSKTQTKLKRLEEITASLQQESDGQKRQVQSMVSDISHQLKTPVANIRMYCDTAVNPALTEDKRAKCLKIVKEQTEKLDFLVKSLVKMSRLENNIIVLHPTRNLVMDMLVEIEERMRLQAEQKNITIEVECPDSLILEYDEKWTAEALLNLVDNSVKYTPCGGKITILAETLELYARITVTDTGIGISPEHINDVCKRFYREERAGHQEGVGIGLYLTREILNKQNGYLKIRSIVGEGTQAAAYLLMK